jgi:hypothetical protein
MFPNYQGAITVLRDERMVGFVLMWVPIVVPEHTYRYVL